MIGFNFSPAIIQLGLSGKWPNDLCAIQRIKAAFYIKIAEGLSKEFHLTVQPYPDCVDILKVRLCQCL
jgi:U3 small nucleolar RNA-associated protein 22